MVDPLVSISCITFNHGSYIKDCLEGFLMQKTSFEFEILIHDDASNDETVEIIKSYQKKYPYLIKPIFQNENQYSKGQRGINMKYNFPRAKGKYIAMCEGDDYWVDPFKLQKQVSFLEQNNDYVVTYHDASVVNEENTIIKKSKLKEENKRDYTAKELQKGAHAQTLTLCFRNIFKSSIPPEVLNVVNGDTFIMSVLGNFGKGKFLSNIAPACYRMHNGGVWSIKTRQKFFKSRIILYFQLMKYYHRIDNIEMKLYFNRKLENIYLGYLEYAVEHRNLYLIKENSLKIFEHSTENKIKNIRNIGKYFIKGILNILKNERHVK